MNISDAELAALGLSGQTSAAAQAQLLAQLWSVVVLQRSGDAPRDPYRLVFCFTTKVKAQAFAATLQPDAMTAVLLYSGATFDSVVAGSTLLADLYCTRAGVAHPAPNAAEVTSAAVEAVKPKPSALRKTSAPAR